ncbi:MAG: response regulator transcription factor [Candidatus Competibacteraceae bacterium]|nr:response regulator transcription factor [Candidatus Competibacteraceae bacterium]
MRIALLEDDALLAQLMNTWLAEAGHECAVFNTGKQFTHSLRRETFDVLVLDWMLPDTDGIQVLRWIREHIDWPIPVLFVTGRDEEADIVQALNQGADDYMTKPVKRLEMLARITAISRRTAPQDSKDILEFGRYRIDPNTRTVYLDDKPIELTEKEFELGLFLFRYACRVLSRGHILENVWGRNPDLNTRTVDTHISRIRHKLNLNAEYGWQLKAVYQHGYRLEQSESLDPRS